ncbi:TonB-dependent receptor [Roseateles sp. DAIF2]|uniref:TonB-dependent receptor domain-containing protein n=1 Tax=Roseateles sp. DAIF2 TaxID=2714952 RepID=UPI0018A271FF|nr:TonB-dependent receptor [Roseateles sp. DAIF2]QPF72898.1 TonB-dependent receptor [Roseateles sp. DAIF2]
MLFAPFRARPLVLALLAAAAAATVQAGTASLDRVVVESASGHEQKVKEAPASVTVITREQLANQPYANLEDAVRHVEGVSVVGPGPSERDIMIRGLPGEYTLILVDGRRQNTRETMNRGTSGVMAWMTPPLEAIERIEVVRGPMSALYGADAMGGVINIITRKNITRWMGSAGLSFTKPSGDIQGDARQLDFWLGGPLKTDLLGLQVYGTSSQRDEDRYYIPANGTTGAYGTKNRQAVAKLSLTPMAGQSFWLEAGSGAVKWELSPGKSAAATAARSETEQARDHWALSHRGQWDWGSSRVALYQESGQQTVWTNGARSASRPEIVNTVFDTLATLNLDSHTLNIGGQISRNRLSGIAGEAPAAGHPANPNSTRDRAHALFAEDEWQISEAFALTTGLRLDDVQRYGSHWSPRVYGVYKLDERYTLRGGFAKGFKSPTLRQTEPGYCMSTGGNSPRRGSLCGNPKLKPEESSSAELGLRFDGEKGRSWSAALFMNKFRNKVVSYSTGKVDPINPALDIYVYDNVDRVKLSGLELAGAWPLAQDWAVSGNYTYTRSRREGGGEPSFDGSSLSGRPLDKTPEHKASLRVDWAQGQALSAYARLNAEGRQYWAAFRNGARNVRERSGLNTVDLGGAYKLNAHLTLSAALLNIADQQVAVDTRSRNEGLNGNWMLDEGRRVWLGLNAKF